VAAAAVAPGLAGATAVGVPAGVTFLVVAGLLEATASWSGFAADIVLLAQYRAVACCCAGENVLDTLPATAGALGRLVLAVDALTIAELAPTAASSRLGAARTKSLVRHFVCTEKSPSVVFSAIADRGPYARLKKAGWSRSLDISRAAWISGRLRRSS